MKYKFLLLCATALLALFPEISCASGGITEFSGPLELVVGTLTGPVGRWLAIASMGMCGITYIMNKEDISGGFKQFLGVTFGISFIAFAGNIINLLFTFSGAII